MEQLNVKNLKEANELYEAIQTIDKEIAKMNALAARAVEHNLTGIVQIAVIDKEYIEQSATENAHEMHGVVEVKKGENPLKKIMEVIHKTKEKVDSVREELSVDTYTTELSTIRILTLMIAEKKAEREAIQRKLINLGYGK